MNKSTEVQINYIQTLQNNNTIMNTHMSEDRRKWIITDVHKWAMVGIIIYKIFTIQVPAFNLPVETHLSYAKCLMSHSGTGRHSIASY